MRPQQPTARLPTQPIARPATASPQSNAAAASLSNNSMGQQMTPDTAKIKCKNFLATLLRLAGEQPPEVAENVRNLIQGLIDGNVEPEIFTTRLQRELNSSPQPCLVPFLKKSLPYLQSSLSSGELTIEGVRAPPVSSLRLPGAASASSAQTLTGAGSIGVRSTLPLPRPPASNVIYQSSARPPASVIRSRGQSPVTTTVVRPSFSQSPLPVTQLQNSANRASKTILSPNMTSPQIVTKGMNKFPTMATKLPTAPVPMSLAGKSPTFATKTVIQSPLGQSYGQTSNLKVSFSPLQPTPPSSLTASSKLSGPTLSASLSSTSLQSSSIGPTKYPDKKSS